MRLFAADILSIYFDINYTTVEAEAQDYASSFYQLPSNPYEKWHRTRIEAGSYKENIVIHG